MGGVETIVKGAEEERKKIAELKAQEEAKAQAKDMKRHTQAHTIMNVIEKCQILLQHSYDEAPGDMRSRIETIRDRCETVYDEFERVYGRPPNEQEDNG